MTEDLPTVSAPSSGRLVFHASRAIALSWLAACVLSVSLVIVVIDQIAAIFGIAEGGRTGIFAGIHKVGVSMARTAWGDARAVELAVRPHLVKAAHDLVLATGRGRAVLHARFGGRSS